MRLDRKATPAQTANTLGHELVHVRDAPKTSSLWELSAKSERDEARYREFLSAGETRAYGEGSRIGGSLLENPFGIGQPITDANVKDQAVVGLSITDGYMNGVKESLVRNALFASVPKDVRAHLDQRTERYLAGYRAELPNVLETQRAWKLKNPPPTTLLARMRRSLHDTLHDIARFGSLFMLRTSAIDSDEQAFAAGRADAQHDLHPIARIQNMLDAAKRE